MPPPSLLLSGQACKGRAEHNALVLAAMGSPERLQRAIVQACSRDQRNYGTRGFRLQDHALRRRGENSAQPE